MDNFTQQLINYLNIIIDSNINLTHYAHKNNIPIYVNGNLDKGWKGNVVEHLLNISKNNKKGSDYENLEIKTVPVIKKDNEYKVKETTCLGVLETAELIKNNFSDSSLYKKINQTLFILIDVKDKEAPFIVGTYYLQIENLPDLKLRMEQDYNTIADQICDNIQCSVPLDNNLTGKLGEVIQPRPKTGKKGNYTWAFYLKTHVLNSLLNNRELIEKPKLIRYK